MLRAFTNAFKVPDLRGKILFTLAIIAVYRLGSVIPTPGVDYKVLHDLLARTDSQQGVLPLLNLLSGGALTQLAVFALGIMPYITASIIMQLLTVVIPRLEEYQKEGESGVRKITQYTRYLTVVLAILQSTGLIALVQSGQLFAGMDSSQLIPHPTLGVKALMILTLTAGTAFIMWLGELITARGVGNGMSLLIFTAIIASFPGTGYRILQQNQLLFAGLMVMALVLIVGVVYIEQGQRRIPVEYAKRQLGRKVYGGTSTYIPLKVNQAGVIPIIFASSLLSLPQLAASIFGNPSFDRFVQRYVQRGDHPYYILMFFILTIFFAYFYTAITFNPIDVADNMKKYGGFIPGIRPGRPTAEYLDRVITRITLPGSLYLATLAVVPFFFFNVAGTTRLPLGGSSLLIVVGVALETMKQVESQLLQRHYEGFLNA
ncbi:MAG: preprotein translocase subunit SecY [Egibacteraceae bacterium]